MLESKLRERLKKYRGRQAYAGKTEPFKVFTDKIIEDIIKAKPTSIVALKKIKGMGEKRIEAYGNDILKIIEECSPRVESSTFFK